jgi:hypothetical protein
MACLQYSLTSRKSAVASVEHPGQRPKSSCEVVVFYGVHVGRQARQVGKQAGKVAQVYYVAMVVPKHAFGVLYMDHPVPYCMYRVRTGVTAT